MIMLCAGLQEVPEFVSTRAMGSVLACHKEAAGFWVSTSGVVSMVGGSPWTRLTPGEVYRAVEVSPVGVVSGAGDDEPSLHLEELFKRNREQRLQYLAAAGMGPDQVHYLVALVADWLDDAEISRLGALSRDAVVSGKGAADLFQAWIDWRSQLRLALAFSSHEPPFKDIILGAAYALCHALTLASASYRADSVSVGPVPVVTAGDDPA